MKFIKSKLLQHPKGNKRGKYLLTLEVTDYDIEMFEEFGNLPTAAVQHYHRGSNPEDGMTEYTTMERYLNRLFHHTFQRLWREHWTWK